jgi:hypothetical protein
MPNVFAYLVAFSWPVVVYVLFRRLPPAAALGWSIVAGYLILPTRAGIDLPLVPTLAKDEIPVLAAALMLLLGVGAAASASWQNAPQLGLQPRQQKGFLVPALMVLLFVSPLVTVLTNPDPIVAGDLFLRGLSFYDAGSVVAGLGLTILPFVLGSRYLASPESHVVLLKILVFALLGYSLLMLYELRMSPQLNRMIYGYFPHSFGQHMRGGGYRPLVFLNHGLWLAILVAMTILAAATLWRQRLSEGARRGHWLFAVLYLVLILFLSSSLGALAIALLLLPAVLIFGVRAQLLLAGIIAGIVLFYPMLRGAGLIPINNVVAISQAINQDRADSLLYRVRHEDALLAKANEKPLAGWGTWGRNRVYDPETGRDLSVTDGAWIIVIGVFGWVGYIAQFGLLTVPIMLLAVRRKSLAVSPATAGLALIMAANLLDLLPNATLTPVTWLIGGALAGRLAYRSVTAPEQSGVLPQKLPGRRSWSLVSEDTSLEPNSTVARRRPRTVVRPN